MIGGCAHAEVVTQLLACLLEHVEGFAREALALIEKAQERDHAIDDVVQRLVVNGYLTREVVEQELGEIVRCPPSETTIAVVALPVEHRRADEVPVAPDRSIGRIRGFRPLLEFVEQALGELVKALFVVRGVDDQLGIVVSQRRHGLRPRETGRIAGQCTRDDRQGDRRLVVE